MRRSEENQLKMFQTRIVCLNCQKFELFILWKVHCFYGTWHNLIRSMKAVKVSYEQNHHHSYWRNFQKTQQPLKNDLWRTTFGEIQPKSKLNRRDTRKQKHGVAFLTFLLCGGCRFQPNKDHMATRPKIKLCSISTPAAAASAAESDILREYLENTI